VVGRYREVALIVERRRQGTGRLLYHAGLASGRNPDGSEGIGDFIDSGLPSGRSRQIEL
jgi:hypothetical protein